MHRRFLYVGGSLAILALVTLLGLAIITVNSRRQSVETAVQLPVYRPASQGEGTPCLEVNQDGFVLRLYGYVDHGSSITSLVYSLQNDTDDDINYIAVGVADDTTPVDLFQGRYYQELGEYKTVVTTARQEPGFRSLRFDAQFDGYSHGAEDIFFTVLAGFDPQQSVPFQIRAGEQTATLSASFATPSCQLALSDMPRELDQAVNDYLNPPATPTPLVCAAPEQWISYHDPVVGMTVLYPPEAKFDVDSRYNIPSAERNSTLLSVEMEIYPACNGHNPDCYESRQVAIAVRENPQVLSLEQYVIQRHDDSGTVTEIELSQYAEALTIDGHKAIRFASPYQSPEWVRRITGHPQRATTPVIFIEHGAYVTEIKMVAPFMGIDHLYNLPCKQAVQIYDEIANRIQFDQ